MSKTSFVFSLALDISCKFAQLKHNNTITISIFNSYSKNIFLLSYLIVLIFLFDENNIIVSRDDNGCNDINQESRETCRE